MKNRFLFTTERLGFRNWTNNDLVEFAAINADLEVMEHFPKPLNNEETAAFIDRLTHHYEKYGYNYFATEILETGEFIGFIGLAFQDYKTDFTPAIDIGWRLKKSAWGKGFATEGAKKCLEYGFEMINLEQIIATCTVQNFASESVMKKIGMTKIGEFNHPKLKDFPELQRCICYELKKVDWQNRS